MTPAARLAEIAHRQRELAAEQAALAEEAAALLQIDSALDGAPSDASSDAGELLGSHLSSVKEIAPRLGMTEKRLRRIAPEIGAEVRIGGRVLIDERVVAQRLNGKFGKIWENSSTDAPEKIGDDSREVNDR